MIDRFCKYLENNRGFSENTIGNYRRTLVKFDTYLKKQWKDINYVDHITLRDVNGFIQVQRLYKSARTCNNYLSAIRVFLYYGMMLGLEVINPKLLLNQRAEIKKIESLTEEETRILLEYFKNAPCWESREEELMKTRNYLIVYMLVYTWVRVTELINIKIDDINDELIIKWKGWKYRPIKLFKDDLDLIKLYLFMRRKYKSDYLFISLSHNNMWEQISRVAVENIVRDGWIKAWIKTKIFPHKLRHTFATSLLRRNANLYHIKELLWHSSISTTQTYLSVVNSELAKTQSLLPRF